MNAWLMAFANALDLHPEATAGAIVAAGKSALVTGYAFGVGITVEAVTVGGAHDVPSILTYAKGHLLAWVITNVLAPAWRGTAAYKRIQAS